MKKLLCLIICALNFSLWSENASQFEKTTGLKGSYNEAEKVFKVSIPRTDIPISVNGSILDPFMGLTSWAAFSPINNQDFMLMGDLVLFEDEVNAVISILFENNIDVTALHNHFFFDQPRTYFMHISGKGPIETLSKGVRKVIEKVQQIRAEFPKIRSGFVGASNSKTNSIPSKKLESIFGMEGQTKNGMIKFTIGRKVKMHGVEFGKEMGVNSWAAFAGSEEQAFVDGDFTVTEDELQPVLRALRKGNINIVAIHNHMTMENPRLLFVHFWGIGLAEELAKTITSALKFAKLELK